MCRRLAGSGEPGLVVVSLDRASRGTLKMDDCLKERRPKE